MAKRETKDRPISLGEGLELPPVLKKSKYPWDKIQPRPDDKEDAPARHFFVGCDDEQEATRLRSSVQAAGTNYYSKRRLDFVPLCRAMKLDGKWGVAAQAIIKPAVVS